MVANNTPDSKWADRFKGGTEKKTSWRLRPGIWALANWYTFLFVTLQLTGIIDWPWWAVLGPTLFLLGLFLLALPVAFVAGVSAAARRAR